MKTLCGILVFVSVFWITHGLTIVEIMKKEPKLRFVARFITNNTVLSNIYNKENITVFLPSNDAYFSYLPHQYGYQDGNMTAWRNILQYTSMDGAIYLDDMKENTYYSSHLGTSQYLYFNYYQKTGTDGYHTVNGARIVRGNIRGDNGIVHIIDKVIAPYCSQKTLPDYLQTPDFAQYSFKSIILAKGVVPELSYETNRSDLVFTSFSPNDSNLEDMPKYGQDRLFNDWHLLKRVYKAHLILYRAQFIPTVGPIPNFISAQNDTLSFTRYNGSVYVSNNRVRARILQANIPVTNGVLHVIDDLLHYVYQNILQKLHFVPEASEMLSFINRLPPSIKTRLENPNENITIFVPTLLAFAKIPDTQQQELRRTDEDGLKALNYLIQGHIIPDVLLTSTELETDQTLTTLDDKVISVIHVGGETYLRSGTVRAKIEVMDIGCTNGVIHLISNVLFMKNFTLWEAIGSIPLVSEMFSFAMDYPDIEESLLSDNTGPRTVFIASNDVMNNINLTYFRSYPKIIHEVMKGQIVNGIHMSSDISKSTHYGTMAGKTLTMYREEDGELYVEGTHVRARIIVKDIWCSNGILHIVDDILHLPVRSVFEEMYRQPTIRFTVNMIRAVPEIQTQLSNVSVNYTVFIPHDDAYSKLQWSTIDGVLKSIDNAKKMLESHIVKGEAKYIDELSDREKLTADRNSIYILRKNGNVFVINNNLWARVITPDIPASNGRIHIIDTIFYLPYMSVAEALKNMEELKPFQDLMSLVPQFNDLITSTDSRNMTLFIPSGKFLQGLKFHHLDKIQNNSKVLKQLFYGHVLPKMRYDDAFLSKYPEKVFVSRSAFDVTFSIRQSYSGSLIDVGYEQHPIDLIEKGFAFTNGVIYIIDNFLNYSPLNLLERLQSEPSVRKSIELLDFLVTPNVTDLLSRDDVMFTFLAPSNNCVNIDEFTKFVENPNSKREEKLKVFWRHVINDSTATYNDLKQGHIRPEALPVDVTLRTTTDDVMFSWNNIQGRVIKSNLLASNGIVHIIDKFLFSPSPVETTAETTTRKPTRKTTGKSSLSPHATTNQTTANAQPAIQGAVSLHQDKVVLLLTIFTLIFGLVGS